MRTIATLLALVLANVAIAAGSPLHNPWHYKGIYLGTKMSRQQIMKQLGATKYENNPSMNPWLGCDKHGKGDCVFNRYGMHSSEWMEFNTGPRCEDSAIEGPGGFYCVNPLMGPDSSYNHGITSVEVFVRHDGTIAAIDIEFDSSFADDFFDTVHRQFYGIGSWENDMSCSGPMGIVGPISPSQPKPTIPTIVVERVCETLSTRRYSVFMTNYDEVTAHVTPPEYRGTFEMKLLDQEL